MSSNEIKTHGNDDFPIELHTVDETHPQYEMAYHWHKNIEIIRILRGELAISLNQKVFVAKEGTIVIINTGAIHGIYPKDCVYEYVSYDPDILPPLAYMGEDFSKNLVHGGLRLNEAIEPEQTEFHHCANALFESLTSDSHSSRYETIGLLCNLYAIIIKNKLYYQVLDTTMESGNHIAKLKKALTYICANYQSDLSLEDMASQAGMSRKYFCTFFKQYTHQSPFDYLISYRISRATYSLLTTEDDITTIAFRHGFNDLSYFIKTFKSIKGMSPGAFRKSRFRQ